jgi:hypothetical protein
MQLRARFLVFASATRVGSDGRCRFACLRSFVLRWLCSGMRSFRVLGGLAFGCRHAASLESRPDSTRAKPLLRLRGEVPFPLRRTTSARRVEEVGRAPSVQTPLTNGRGPADGAAATILRLSTGTRTGFGNGLLPVRSLIAAFDRMRRHAAGYGSR